MRWVLLLLLTGCAEATAPVDRGCGSPPTDRASAIAYTRCVESR